MFHPNRNEDSEQEVAQSSCEFFNDVYEQHDMEILNVPENENENVIEIVVSIAELLNVPIDASEIVYAFRINNKHRGKNRSIIVNFTTSTTRYNLLVAAMEHPKGICTEHLELFNGNKSATIYLREHQSPESKKLFCLAKSIFTKEENYKHVWVQDEGVIMCRDDKTPVVIFKFHKGLDCWTQIC